jgi:uncharacterized membrane protein YdjX (TVP38/TMEM64 family)
MPLESKPVEEKTDSDSGKAQPGTSRPRPEPVEGTSRPRPEPVEGTSRPCPEAAEVEAQGQSSWIKPALTGLVVALLIIVVYLSPLRGYLGDLQELSRQIRSFGALAPLVLALGVAWLVAIGFPRLVLCALAGMALGFWSGLFWAQLGTLVGNYIFFGVVRAGAGDWLQRFVRNRPRLQALVQQGGVTGVILARQLPVPGAVVNLSCAVLPIRHADFLLGTALGQLPQAIPCTLIGAGVLQPSLGRSIGLIVLGVAVSLVAWLGVRYLVRQTAAK